MKKKPIQFGEATNRPETNQSIEIDFRSAAHLKDSLKKASLDIKKDVDNAVSSKAQAAVIPNTPVGTAAQQPPPLTSSPLPTHAFSGNIYSNSVRFVSLSMLMGLLSIGIAPLILLLPYIPHVATYIPLDIIRQIASYFLYVAVGISLICSLLTILTPHRLRALLGFGLCATATTGYYLLVHASFIRH